MVLGAPVFQTVELKTAHTMSGEEESNDEFEERPEVDYDDSTVNYPLNK